VRLAVDPARVPVLAGMPAGCVIPAWASHGEGRLAAGSAELERIAAGGHVAFVYCDARGNAVPAPQGSALDAAALTNVAGNVLAIMPHPERDAWTFMHRVDDPDRAAARLDVGAMLRPSGGSAFFTAFAAALGGRRP
jgi:phosphoribosylformylglycinamidine (FGAM) synthase-like amidotransferase family enzyme